VRGAFNKLVKVKDQRVIAASMWNHAQAVAYAAGKLGKQAKIVMPETASLVKQEATKGYGAEVVLHGELRGRLSMRAIMCGGFFLKGARRRNVKPQDLILKILQRVICRSSIRSTLE
jgi:hypothetical protein